MKEQLNAYAVCDNTCFRHTRQVSNLLKSATSNKSDDSNDKINNYNNNIIIIIQINNNNEMRI